MKVAEPSTESYLLEVANGTVDYKGRVASKRTTGGLRAAPLIFGAEMCERIAAYGIGANLVPYLVIFMHISSSDASNIFTNFVGTSYVCCLIGGYVADAWLGRFWTVTAAAIAELIAILVLTLVVTLHSFRPPPCSPPEIPCQKVHGLGITLLYIGLYLMAVGTGGIKACVSAFGADQFDATDPKEKKQSVSYFNYFFVFITVGAIISVTVVVWIEEEYGRGVGYAITGGAMFVSVIVFIAGKRLYRYSISKGSPFNSIYTVLIAAIKKRKLALPSDISMLHEIPEKEIEQGYPLVQHTDQFRFLDKAAIIPAPPHDNNNSVAEASLEKVPTVTQVEEVKMFVRQLPVLFTTFFQWTVYAQIQTFSVLQAFYMNRTIGSFLIPAASIGVFVQLSILVSILFYDRGFVPIMRRYTGRLRGITLLQRMGSGLLASILAMIIAAVVERKRLTETEHHAPGYVISVFWLLPQYILVGASEALTYVGQLEFFYSESPDRLRSVGTALSLCTLSVGFYASSFIVSVVQKVSKRGSSQGWLATNLNQGRLDNFYWLLAVLSTLNLILFLLAGRWYKYRIRTQEDYSSSTLAEQ